MKRFICIILFIGIISIFTINVSASENEYSIIGLENIPTKIEAGTNPECIDFVKGLELYSNENVLIKEKLLVDYQKVDFNRVGRYEIYYYVLFIDNNQELRYNIASLEIEIIDTTKPTIHGVKPLSVKVNEDIDYLAGVSVTDNDLGSRLEIKVLDYNVDVSQPGIYNLTYSVQDDSGNVAYKSTKVYVESFNDNYLPEIVVDEKEFYIMVNQENPQSIYLEKVSAFDGPVNLTPYLQYFDANIDYTKIGEYEVTFMVMDFDGNVVEKKVPVHIIEDNDAPYFLNLKDVYDLTINTLDFTKGIKAYDDVCGDVSNRIEVIYDDFNNTIEGYYWVKYRVSDLNGNACEKNVLVHVYDNLPPVISSPDTIYLKVGDTFDISSKIHIFDNVDGVIQDYQIKDNDVNLAKVGLYIVEISARDKRGNEAIKKITFYVYDDNPKHFYESPIIMGSIVSIIVSGIINYYAYHKVLKKYRRY